MLLSKFIHLKPSSSSVVIVTSKQQNSHGNNLKGRRMHILWKDLQRDPSRSYTFGFFKNSSKSSYFRHRFSNDALRVDGLYNPSWDLNELRRSSSAVSPPGKLCVGKQDNNHRKNSFENPNFDDGFSFVKLLKECAKKKDVCKGVRLHAYITQGGILEKNPYIASSLINMYAKCGMLSKAREVHDELRVRKLDSWNALIGGLAQQGQGQEALNCFEHMKCEGLSPDFITYISILKASGVIECLSKGQQIHKEIVSRSLLGRSVLLGTALVGMYAKCGEHDKAYQVLEELPIRNVFSWNALIGGYAEWEQGQKAFVCFKCMQGEGLSPDAVTFTCILNVCSSIVAIGIAEEIHKEISNRGLLEKDVLLGNALVDMYVKCGMLSKAQKVHDEHFSRNVVTWNALISGYAQQEQGHKALNCFEQMQRKGLSPDAITYVCILKACGSIGTLYKGEQIHDEIVNRGLLENNVVLATALVDMYAKCGALVKAHSGFEEIRVRNVVSWNALITGYVQHGQEHEALNSFERLRTEGFLPNVVTFTCILKACGSVGAIDKGKQIHDEIVNLGLLKEDLVLGNALVDMYAKCGVIGRAQQVHDELCVRDVVSWNSLITGYAEQGQGKEALYCFHLMQAEGFSPDGMTLLGVLNACSHSGQFEEAQMYFSNMSQVYGLIPDIEHHTCIVVALGCIGCFDKAMSVISTIPSSYDLPLWLALMNACRKWGNVELAKLAFDQTLKLDHNCAAAYVLMGYIYSAAGMEEDAQKAEAMSLNEGALSLM